jgi:magnesium chelatase subunit I
MEERDVQIKGYKIRLPLDIFLVASANPEDYTNRGRIITPLKDRFGAQIRTHYPKEIEQEIQIMDKEREPFDLDGQYQVRVPQFMKEVVAEFTNLARKSPDVNQRSGVSVRVSIGNYETVISNALRRAIVLKEPFAAPRVSDLRYLQASTQGKIEIESMEEGREPRIIEDLLKRSVLNTFNRHFSVHEFDDLLRKFDEGVSVEVGEVMNSQQYLEKVGDLSGMRNALKQLDANGSPAEVASAVEFVLEGLHLNRRLNKDKQDTTARYRA